MQRTTTRRMSLSVSYRYIDMIEPMPRIRKVTALLLSQTTLTSRDHFDSFKVCAPVAAARSETLYVAHDRPGTRPNCRWPVLRIARMNMAITNGTELRPHFRGAMIALSARAART